MTNVTKIEAARDLKSARQSVRAKVRKALAVPGAELTAAQVKSLESVMTSLNKALAPAKKAAPAKAKTTKAKPAKVTKKTAATKAA